MMKKFCWAVGLVCGMAHLASAQALVPGWLTDPTAVKGAANNKDSSVYKTPEAFKYPYISTYYVKPTVTPEEVVKVAVYVTDFDHSKVRFLDDSHRFTAFLEIRRKGETAKSKILTLKDVKSGDHAFKLGKLPVGAYELRVWAQDAKGRESHRVIHDFRVMTAESLVVPADKVYRMTAADLEAYGIRNDGDLEEVVLVGADQKDEVLKRKRAGVPGYTVTVPRDAKTGKVPYRAYEKVSVAYDEGYDKEAVEAAAVATREGLQKLIDEKAAAGYRKFVMLPGTYRVSHTAPLFMPDNFTLDLGKATLKLNAFTGAKCTMLRFASAIDAHLVNGTIEGDYWSHDYKGSEKDSEWVNGFQLSGDCWYCSVEGVKVVEITGYGGSNYIENDKRGSLAFVYEQLPKFAPGGLDRKTGQVDLKDTARFTTDYKSLSKALKSLPHRRLQISKYLGYQGVRTRSWQMTVAWYNEAKQFISAETAFQYREMWIPEGAAYLRVSVEEESVEAANPSYTEALTLTAMRYPINCTVKNCRFEHCRCVGYAAAQMKNWLFEGNYFTTSGEAEAKCAFDAEDGGDQMQDTYLLGNVFENNPVNNSILTCAGHNYTLEKNRGGVHFWGRTYSSCVRDNEIDQAVLYCDSRVRTGYVRIEENSYSKGIKLGLNDWKKRPDNWDIVLSGRAFDGSRDKFSIDVGNAGRIVGCTFKDMAHLGIGNAYACTFERCKGWFTKVNWTEVTVKDSEFKNFYNTNHWNRCHFENTKLNSIGAGTLVAKDCDFKDSTIFGIHTSTVAMRNCTFNNSTVESNWWEQPAKLLFKNCTINLPEKSSFVKTGVYTIGDYAFDGCTVKGKQPLVHVKDLRPLGKDPATSTDRSPGRIALKNMHWQSDSKLVVTHGTGGNEPISAKQIVIDGTGSVWSPSVKLAEDLFPTWKVR